MLVLLDACVWGGAQEALYEHGHDVEWIGDLPEDPGDEAVLAQAWDQKRVLVTLDKDFGELAIVRRLPHAGIIRLVGIRAARQGSLCVSLLATYAGELASGAIITAEPGRVRVRPAGPVEVDSDSTDL